MLGLSRNSTHATSCMSKHAPEDFASSSLIVTAVGVFACRSAYQAVWVKQSAPLYSHPAEKLSSLFCSFALLPLPLQVELHTRASVTTH